ncbi:hypothetical protein D3C72_1779750 [compost metagenome]
MAHVCQKVCLGPLGALGRLLGLAQRRLHFMLARDIEDDAVPDPATLDLARRRADTQPDQRAIRPAQAKVALEQAMRRTGVA